MAMTRAYRVFYTTFYEDEHERIKTALKELLGIEPVEHRSFISEFRYLEFKGDSLQPGMDEKIREVLKSILGKEAGIKVDYINV